MQLSRLVLNLRSASVLRDLADAQAFHRTLMMAFGTAPDGAAARDHFGVLYRREMAADTIPVVLVASLAEPRWEALPPGYLVAEAAMRSTDAAYDALAPGQVLRFRLVASPTKSVPSPSVIDGSRERGTKRPVHDRDEAVVWLRRRLETAGVELLDEHEVAPADAAHGKRGPTGQISLHGYRFDGMLRVRDADALRHALAEGIGPGKAYGFGMLTVARIG